ncbi:MAG: hypothetical protein JMDDDDMK_01594 [Acidobacteria bacterium]|nr:hypothetical protein [Acidobacteriota bacterium]
MREKFLIAILVVAAAMTELFPGVNAQDAATKAQQLINQARAALGGDKLKSLRSLSATGNYRRTFGQMEMSGEVNYDLLLPDKMMKTEVMSPMPSLEITRIETINGEEVWEDQQQHGGGGGMVIIRRGPGGANADPKQAQAALQQGVRSDFARLLIGWLLTTPSSFPVEYSYAGEAESPDGKADALDVKGPGGFAARLFLDQKTHRPLMLTYNGKKPRVITQTMTGPPRNREDAEKRVKEMETEAAKQPDVEYRINLDDYRDVNGISFPHKLTRSIENEVNEELEITKVKINPQIKPEKFVKK